MKPFSQIFYIFGFYFRKLFRIQPSESDILVALVLKQIVKDPGSCSWESHEGGGFFNILKIGDWQFQQHWLDSNEIYAQNWKRNLSVPIARRVYNYILVKFHKLTEKPITYWQIQKEQERKEKAAKVKKAGFASTRDALIDIMREN